MIRAGRQTGVRPIVLSGAGICSRDRYVETVPAKGYRFIGAVTAEARLEGRYSPPEPPVEEIPATRSRLTSVLSPVRVPTPPA